MPSYRERRLGPPLDDCVECVWFLSESRGAPATNRIPPDGCVEAIFHVGDRFDEIDHVGSGARRRRQPAAFVVGVWTRPIVLASPSAFDTIGIRFRPGCASLFMAPAAELANRSADAPAIWGTAASTLIHRLADARDEAGRLDAIRAFLLDRLRPSEPVLSAALAAIHRTSGRVSIDALAQRTGVGHRRLERAFQEHVGVPAKTLCRIVRFQNVLRRATPDSAAAWADLALACGYTDQSHLIRDFRQFAGETPAQLAAAEPSLADYFRRR